MKANFMFTRSFVVLAMAFTLGSGSVVLASGPCGGKSARLEKGLVEQKEKPAVANGEKKPASSANKKVK